MYVFDKSGSPSIIKHWSKIIIKFIYKSVETRYYTIKYWDVLNTTIYNICSSLHFNAYRYLLWKNLHTS